MEDFEISVVIPSYNGENFIAEAIDCVRTQSYPAKEIIVVDDGSTDRTVEIVASMSGNIRLISQQHTGMPASGRNRGIRESRGNMIALLDQDDIWPENALKIHVGNMIRYPGIFVDAGKVQKMVMKPGEDKKMNFEYYNPPKNFYLLSSLLIRKNVFEKIGLFDENLKFFGSDFDWLLRLREAELLINIHDQVTLFYRLHDQNHSNDQILLQRAMLEVFKKSMNRRRTGHPESLKPFPEFNTVANHPYISTKSLSHTMNQQKISVIIPVFNGKKFIADAIESVFEQHYSPLELIVVDDGSTDRTIEVVQSFEQEIVLISQTNQGVAAARNAGLQRATGDLITFLDADDVWVNNKLVLQTGILEKHPEVDVVFGTFLEVQFLEYKQLKLYDLNNFKGHLNTSLGSMLIKREVFDKIGCFDTDMRSGEDLDWLNRVRESGGRVMVHSEIVQFYRKHSQSLNSNQEFRTYYIFKAYKKVLERKKSDGINSQSHPAKMINFENVIKQLE